MPQKNNGDKKEDHKGAVEKAKEVIKEELEEVVDEVIEDKLEVGKQFVEKREKDKEMLKE
jgi:hypothetical protein